ncbi:glucitol operon activator protein [Oceanobacillus oncorhynchi subsp. incaldanensis]|uniref:DNA-binding transcriptional activator GutM n=2 Tax=Oceanobacillus TaxID=182709 RepID=A0A0A1MVB5_9BACI|nr:transcriptional regulator GutM [Oceanobacillus oncorhynchi]MDM8099669.1 transcriptional regulator GutM [Oceanobacillus oncorhynchi]UUI41878.1 transcriptional regulator GutM [Oceanobacillus oncorhynchi]GIO19930.1 glucitol operon activator protein [Oceanobacillus oncorhynchi subsp. incaldanensis]CEI83382.1 DNA-binding transcriptional activator GutM [Oceanobacillus oncorhynchi]
MWGTFILIFAFVWGVQFLMTQLQVKHYRSNIKSFTNRKSGFLGTGYFKKRFGTGALVLLVSDENLQVVEAKIMKGITVFARFKDRKELIGKDLFEVENMEILDAKEKNAVQGAVKMIEKEFEKKGEKAAWIS